ncbi:flagellar motor protein MotB [Flavobacterium sufflavum]|uniref:Flagellar motor protein MotB n=1 Tax=Flavobacterium sufflavum TaxID=1921138 RepID=A0A437KKL0_9FLAO|nr:OmpA family protein [Flavobacterium sufflavum]RVT71105.1 flagellar motor protein MotB [Flavobacterium sufflavum]
MKEKLLLLILFPLLVFSQQKEIKKAEEKFNDGHYIESIKIFENLIDKGVETASIFEKLGDANYLNANYAEANRWYSKRYALTPEMDSEHHYRYAQTLKSVGLQEESKKQMATFESKSPNEIRTKFNKNESKEKSMLTFSNVQMLPINSKFSDYGTAIKGDTIIFASARDFVLDNTTYARTNQSYTSLYQSIKTASGTYSSPKLFSKASFSIYHEATPVFTKDGKTMYYSQNQLADKSKSKLVNGLFKLYKSVLVDGKWKNKGIISLNQNDSVRMANPALSPDGKYLYFASDLKGSFGNSDLFKVAINADGSFGTIEHLSDKINTEGRETFPFITEDNTLVFASDGHAGLGGLDLFSIDLSDKNAVAINLGPTINSAFDDFALAMNTEMNQGYYTSNRPNGTGDDDLYSFDSAVIPITISGTIVEAVTNEIIPNTAIALLDKSNNVIAKTQSDSKGNFVLNNVKRDANYKIKVEQNNYVPVEKLVVIAKKDVNEIITIHKEVPKIQPETDLSNLFALNIIYFDTDKSFIREEAKTELDKVVAIMNQYPQIKVVIGSHTDSRESEAYNENLSQRRANATLKYLVSKGIDKTRLIAKGYGESQLVNQCKNGVRCSNEEHQKNRRSTFIVRK